MKKVAVLGSTGSIGAQTLDIACAHKDKLSIVALAANGQRRELLVEQILEFMPELVSVGNAETAALLKDDLNAAKYTRPIEIMHGMEGLIACATHEKAATLVTGIVGSIGIRPTAAAIEKGKTIALANKETLVAAGPAIVPMLEKYKSQIIPVDSEHSAIFQSLSGYNTNDVEEIILTASGGPFRTWSKEKIASATIDDALKHPNWAMGKKITIDSATLMNKGLEVIEARWLFNIPATKIKVVIHPQSILHSAVQYVDGSIIGQMGLPDMRLPIHYALFYPDRVYSSRVPRLDLSKLASMTFEEPDLDKFPCLALAKEAAKSDDNSAAILNAANEIAVEAFLNGKLSFTGIAKCIENVMSKANSIKNPSLDDILMSDNWARQETTAYLLAYSC